MPQPCAVCAHLARPEIDARLCQHTVNLAAIAREFGIGRKSVERHRIQHLPTFLKVYGARVDLPNLSQLHAEALRVYMATLDELGRAQAGVLAHIDDAGHEVRVVSHTAIARLLDGARKSVDQLARLAADGANPDERPAGMATGELSERITAQLARIVARNVHGDAVLDAEECIALPAPSDEGVGEAGGLPVEPTGTSSSTIRLDAVTPLETLPGVKQRPALAKLVADDAKTIAPSPPLEDSPLITVPNPRCPLSPSASAEERAAAGYPDITITLEDLKSNADIVSALLAEHQSNANP